MEAKQKFLEEIKDLVHNETSKYDEGLREMRRQAGPRTRGLIGTLRAPTPKKRS